MKIFAAIQFVKRMPKSIEYETYEIDEPNYNCVGLKISATSKEELEKACSIFLIEARGMLDSIKSMTEDELIEYCTKYPI